MPRSIEPIIHRGIVPNLPHFKYHPDPLKTGAVAPSEQVCSCCGMARGYAYTAGFYAEEEVDTICPWCIADGSAAARFDGSFTDEDALLEEGVPQAVIDEVCQRTPGFQSWQEAAWRSHCNDACEFHGDATVEEVSQLSGESLAELLADEMIKPQAWPKLRDAYTPGGATSIFRFQCRHCGKAIYALDRS